MAELVTQDTIDVLVDFYGFALQDEDDLAVPVPFPDDREMGDEALPLLTVFERRLDFGSAGHTHTAVLAWQVWTGEPPADDSEPWEERDEAEIYASTGVLSVEAAAGDARLDLGAADQLWKVRVSCAGRAEVARRAPVEVPEGVERYLAQFWPAAA
ncbi:hypothetical protein AB1339_16905 [Streptomyces cyaneofuscatus]|uniref:hypothetical protein n=1 Tax=Streptomyces cyaneofuscatus TaxID=66883 RepID=UPI00345DC087